MFCGKSKLQKKPVIIMIMSCKGFCRAIRSTKVGLSINCRSGAIFSFLYNTQIVDSLHQSLIIFWGGRKGDTN